MSLTVDAEHLAHLDVYSPVEGWDCVSGFLLVRGRLDIGVRTPPKLAHLARPLIEQVGEDAIGWDVLTFDAAVDQPRPANPLDWDWAQLYPVDDRWGFAVALVAVADEAQSAGEWRTGPHPVLPETPSAAKVDADGHVVAILAPARRADGVVALQGQEDRG